jgi:hypothetical protein
VENKGIPAGPQQEETTLQQNAEAIVHINTETWSKLSYAQGFDAIRYVQSLNRQVNCPSCVRIQRDPKEWLDAVHEKYLLTDRPLSPIINRRTR